MALTVRPAKTPLVSTAAGTIEWTVLLLPSRSKVDPQQKAWPPAMAQTLDEPTLMALTVRPAKTPLVSTATGTSELAVLLLPIWPDQPSPQQKAWPPAMAQTLDEPTLMAVTVRPAKTPLVSTATGTDDWAVLLLPSRPLLPLPQQKAWPSATAQL